MITLGPQGDVVVKTQGESLLVSSRVLSLSSPVLARMLASPFKEGLSCTNDASSPRVITLLDDDSEALELYCNVVHFQHVPVRPSARVLIELARLCDKYDCSEALHSWGQTWSAAVGWVETTRDEEWSRMVLTYVLGARGGFERTSRALLLDHHGSFTDLERGYCPFLRYNLAGQSPGLSSPQ